MTSVEAVTENPRLRWITRANLILAIAFIVRLVPEIIAVLPRGPNTKYFAILTLDLVIAALWLTCGLALRKHRHGAVGFAAITGAIILAHSLDSGYFVGVQLVKEFLNLSRSSSDYLMILALTGSRLLIYAIEFLVWPFLLIMLLRLAGEEQESSARRSVGIAIVGFFLVALVAQAIILNTALER